MSIDVSQILADTANTDTLVDYSMADSGTAQAQIQNNNVAMDASYQASFARGQVVADATRVVSSTHNQGALIAQTAAQNYAHSLGIDADGSLSAQQLDAQNTFLAASARARDAAATIAQKRSVSFFDDPLSWISNKLTINDDINTYNGAANEANTAEQFIQESNQLVDARTVALKNIETVTSQAAAEAQTNIVVAQQQELAETQRRAGIAANTAGVEAVQNMSWRQIQLAGARTDADAKYIQVQDAQEQLRLAHESRNMEQQRLDMEKLKEQERDGADQYMSAQLRKGLQILYPNNPDAWNIPDGKYKAWLTGKSPLDPRWAAAFNAANASDAAGGKVMATSPANAVDVLQYNPTIGPAAQPTVDLLKRARVAAASVPEYKQADASKDVKTMERIINDTANRMVQTDAAKTDSPTSLYYLPPIDKIAEQNPGLKDSPVYQKVIAPAAATGLDVSQPGTVASLAVGAVNAGVISLNDAATGIALSYKQGQEANFQAKQLFQLGIVAPVTYVTPSKSRGIFAGTVDWTNPVAVKKELMHIEQNVTTQTGFRNPLSR